MPRSRLTRPPLALRAAAPSPTLPRAVALALALAACTAASAATPRAYVEKIPDSSVSFEMVPVAGGSFRMGSPAGEAGRKDDEGPQAEVTLKPFWIGKHEVTWSEYDLYRRDAGIPVSKREGSDGDAITRPTPPYADESWGYGKGSQPAIGMTWHAAMAYTRWLSAKTGKHYRLATEAEWEYAARAGSSTPWASGSDAKALDALAWHAGNANGKPHRVGGKQANAFGLHDMHGNVGEWTLDQYQPQRYAALKGKASDPVALPGAARFPHVVRGGSFEDEPAQLRSAARRASKPGWSRRDPQEPRSIWWHTDASFVGFRVVRTDNDAPTLKGFTSRVTRASPDK
jgi:formylglycine-generating enzyme required for sulfatase activity